MNTFELFGYITHKEKAEQLSTDWYWFEISGSPRACSNSWEWHTLATLPNVALNKCQCTSVLLAVIFLDAFEILIYRSQCFQSLLHPLVTRLLFQISKQATGIHMQTKLGGEAWEHTTSVHVRFWGLRNHKMHENILEVLLTEPAENGYSEIQSGIRLYAVSLALDCHFNRKAAEFKR